MISRFIFRQNPPTSTLARYGVAVASVLLLLVVRLLLHPVLGMRSQYTIFLFAVLFTAWYSGSLPALFALALGAFFASVFFVEPYFSIKLENLSDALAVAFYMLVGVAIIYLIELFKQHERRLAAQITKQVDVEDALRQSEERFRLATEALQGAIYDWDAASDHAYRSPAIFDIVGYQPAEIQDTRKWWQNLMHPDDYNRVQQSLQGRVAERASTHSVEYRVRHKNGHYIWVWDKSRISYDADGKLARLIGCTLSIDERKQAEDALYANYTLTANLAQAIGAEEVAQTTIDYLLQQTNAKAGTVYVYDSATDTFDLLYANLTWAASGKLAEWYRFPADPTYPLTDVVKNRKALWFATIPDYEAAYPAIKTFSHLNQGATVMLPLVAASGVFGGISLLFAEPRQFTDEEKALIASLISQCAQALERARLAGKAQNLAVIEERHRLARDLHDNVSQLLFSSSVISEILPRMFAVKPEKAIHQAGELHFMVRGAMAEMRTLLWELRPESIIQTKFSNLLTQLAYAAESRQGCKVSLIIHAKNEFIAPPDVQIAFYRIAQECLHNALKHSHATLVTIRFKQTPNRLLLTITDNGQGFDTQTTSAGFGLKTMRERAASIGAIRDLKSRLGEGTRMRLMWDSPQPFTGT